MSHPDEVILDSLMNENEIPQPKTGAPPKAHQKQHISRTNSMPALRGPNGAQLAGAATTPQNAGASLRQDNNKPRIAPPQASHSTGGSTMPPPAVVPNNQPRPSPQRPSDPQKPESERQEPSIGFINSRAAEVLTKSETPPGQVNSVPVFNPHAESPSIRRTSGVNHAKSEPINRKVVVGSNGQVPGPTPPGALNGLSPGGAKMGPGPKPNKSLPQGPVNFVNPQSDPSRQIGMPSVSSPLANRGGYRPPVMKRPAPGNEVSGAGNGPGRMPLTDVSNVAAGIQAPSNGVEGVKGADPAVGAEVGGDAKRPKMSSSG